MSTEKEVKIQTFFSFQTFPDLLNIVFQGLFRDYSDIFQ